ncbi:hypothetical protein [Candidatus Binatus sp.]|uniref:hypothetical protein n=1 Tax=Candidatus Binatus sp. TaxID=2811406 RepID=UPI002F9525BE
MARAEQLAVEARRQIASQIGERLSREHPMGEVTWWVGTHGKGKQPLLAETFEIWALTHSALQALQNGLAGLRPDRRLIEFAENTRHFHHQIRREGGRSVGYARSMVSRGHNGSDQWTLQTVRISPIADMIDRAIRWIDVHTDTGKREAAKEPEHLVRLLIIPQYHIHAFWLEGRDGDWILVVNSPRSTAGLKPRRLYGWFEFLEALSKLKVRASVMATTTKKSPPSLPRDMPRKRKKRVKAPRG